LISNFLQFKTDGCKNGREICKVDPGKHFKTNFKLQAECFFLDFLLSSVVVKTLKH